MGLFAIIYSYCFDLSKVVSGSMSPALIGQGDANSDWVLIDKVTYRFRQPRRWEVVQFDNSEHLDVAKRVVGLPGEKVSIQDHDVVINGNRLTPPPSLAELKYIGCAKLYRGREAECGTGYFVLGRRCQGLMGQPIRRPSRAGNNPGTRLVTRLAAVAIRQPGAVSDVARVQPVGWPDNACSTVIQSA